MEPKGYDFPKQKPPKTLESVSKGIKPPIRVNLWYRIQSWLLGAYRAITGLPKQIAKAISMVQNVADIVDKVVIIFYLAIALALIYVILKMVGWL